MTIALAPFDGARHLNKIAQQQQFFGDGGLTRIRV